MSLPQVGGNHLIQLDGIDRSSVAASSRRAAASSPLPRRRSPRDNPRLMAMTRRTRTWLLLLVGLPLACRRGEPIAAESSARPAHSVASAPSAAAPALAASAGTAVASLYSKVALPSLADVGKQPDLAADRPRELPPGARPHRSQLAFSSYIGGTRGFCGIVAGRSHRCWGHNLNGLGLGQFTDTAVGDDFACALDAAGAVRCDPGNRDPRGAGSKPAVADDHDAGVDAAVPRARIAALAAQGTELCLLGAEGEATCFSRDPECTLTPPEGARFTEVAVGKGCAACGITRDAKVSCWGGLHGTELAVTAPKQLAVGQGFACAIDGTGLLSCSGAQVPAGARATAVEARGARVCWQDEAGALACNQGAVPGAAIRPRTWAITEVDLCYETRPNQGDIACTADPIEGAIPPNPMLDAHPTWAESAGRHAELVAERNRFLGELLAPMPRRALPLELDERLEVPVGPTVESRYLFLLNNLPVDYFDDAARPYYSRDYRYGFTIPLPDGRRSATFFHQREPRDEWELVWFVFSADGEVARRTPLLYRGHYALPYDHGCERGFQALAGGEEVTRSSLNTSGNLATRTLRTHEQAEYDPINKRWVYVCATYESSTRGTLTAEGLKVDTRGFLETSKTIGGTDCEQKWPLGRPPWVVRVAPDRAASSCKN